jgi:transposase
MCSGCEEQLFFVGIHSIEEQKKTATMCRMQNKKPPMYGVLKCPHCKSSNASEGTFPKKHWHRDINASINIGKAYLFAARNGGTERPSYLKRPEKVIA